MPTPDNLEEALLKARRVLAKLEEKARGFGSLHVPVHLEIELEDQSKIVADLEARLANPGLEIAPEARPLRQHPILHQRYLTRLVEQVGTLNLALISPEQTSGINLEEVYVDSPTPLAIDLEVKDGKVIDWWISRKDQVDYESAYSRANPGHFPMVDYGYERAPLEALVGKLAVEYLKKPRRIGNTEIHLHLKHLAAARNRLVILGAPGSGKSTFVRYLALCLAGAGIEGWTRDANLTSLENWPHGTLTPVYVELRRFVTSTYFPPTGAVTAEHLWKYIENALLGEELKEYARDLRNELEEGYGLLILDGLDEVPYDERKLKERQTQLSGLAQSLQTRFGGSRIIVTSRPNAYEGWNLPGFEAIRISEFEDEHRQELAERLYRASGLREEEAQAKAEALNEQLEGIDPKLKDRPLFVTLMATLYLKGGDAGLPSRKGTLYRESLMLLLDRWTRSRPGAPSLVEILGDKTVEELYGRLAALAYAVHDSSNDGEGTAEIKEGLLLEYLRPFGKHVRMDIITYLCENAGVLLAPGQRGNEEVFHYAHRTFEEYLAAAHLVGLYEKEESFRQVKEVITGKPETWRVPCGFVGDVLADTGRKVDLWQLLGELLEEEPPKSGDDPHWWLGWLGATIVEEQGLYHQKKLNKLTEQPVWNALVKWLVALLETAQALLPVERAMCGRVLGLLGDTRKGVGLRLDGLPEIEWCEITAPEGGKFVMGAKNEEDSPHHEAQLGYSFKMAKYPITYRQFQSFVGSGEYDKGEWWEGFPQGYQPQELDQGDIKENNRPRDNVSWYQAVAFTRWLTTKYWAVGVLKEGEEVRLPTEQEWEYAARSTDERQYPYGNEFDATKGNTNETGIGSSSAVGSFPDGVSPFGVLDMSGNMWEWCLNKYSNPKEIAVDASGDDRVLRGGSFPNHQDDASCLYRYSYPPNVDLYGLGVRVVVGSDLSRPSDL